MFATLLAVAPFWHLLPLALVVSVVYSATRHEEPAPIIRRAVRWFILILAGMLIIFLLLQWLSAPLSAPPVP